MARIEKINSLLLQALAKLTATEINLPDCLITISYAECTPDLRSAKIGVSVLPEKYTGSALKKLRQKQKIIKATLRKQLKLKYIPTPIWQIDKREREAAKIETVLKQINNDNNG